MSDVINSEESENVKIQKYEFGKLSVDLDDDNNFDINIFKETAQEEQEKLEKEPEPEPSQATTELLEKVDLLTSEIVSLQMELESQKTAHQEALKNTKKESFDEGKEEGIKETNETFQNDTEDLKSQLVRSITLLEEQKNSLDSMFINIEEDLVESALLIAKKVIKKEIENDSVKVTKSIATALIDTLKSVTEITLKVNPNDYKVISEHFNQDSIMIVSDDAISPGGVIILNSDTNIDATISTRLDKAMELIGKE